MGIFDEFSKSFNKRMDEQRSPENLRIAADKIDGYAKQIDDVYTAVLGFVDSLSGQVFDTVARFKNTANDLRNEANGKDNAGVSKPSSGEKTRDEKIKFIQDYLRSIGVTHHVIWHSKDMSKISDADVDMAYAVFGGK